MGGSLGAIGAGLDFQNPASAAQPYLNNLPQQLSPYYQPYIDAGQQQLSGLNNQYGQLTGQLPGLQNQFQSMAQNPGQYLNQIGSNYQQSPGYQFQVQQATNAANRQGAATGMQGSPEMQQNLAQTVGGLANQDYYNYLGNALQTQGQGLQGQLGLYGQGLQGMQGLYGIGAGAANNYGNNLGEIGMTQAQLAYAGQNAQNQNNSSLFGGLGNLFGNSSLSGIGSAIGNFF